jgi:hypothetical protein
MPAWATYLVRVVLTGNGRRIIGVGESYSLGGWWFNYPARAARHWKYGIRQHGMRRFLEFRRESWKFTREWRRR